MGLTRMTVTVMPVAVKPQRNWARSATESCPFRAGVFLGGRCPRALPWAVVSLRLRRAIPPLSPLGNWHWRLPKPMAAQSPARRASTHQPSATSWETGHHIQRANGASTHQPRATPWELSLVGILDNLKSPSVQTGGTADHVHSLFLLGRTISQADVVEEVKKGSSKWMKAEGRVPGFTWQAGYGAFSIGESQADAVIRYIQNQEEHHRKVTFQEEFRKFLERYKVAYDERYVWD